MAGSKLTLYYDIVSPFGYLAYYVTRHSPVFKNVQVTYIPVLLGGIMRACGNITPLDVKNKDKWINKERQRWAHQFNIPCADKAPDGFPVSTLAAQRALTAISLTSPAQLLPATDALYNAIWGPNRNSAAVHTPAGLLSVLSSVIGEDQAKEMMASADAKKKLGEATDEALAKGAFGMPYFVATDAQGREETYWGFDHLGQVLQHMGLEKEGLGQGARSML